MTNTTKFILGASAIVALFFVFKPKKAVPEKVTAPPSTDDNSGGGGGGGAMPMADSRVTAQTSEAVSNGTTSTISPTTVTSATNVMPTETTTDPNAGRPSLNATPTTTIPTATRTGIKAMTPIAAQLGFSGPRRNGFVPSGIIIGNTTL